MTILWQDIRYGLRQLHKSPGFTTVAVLAAWIPASRAARIAPIKALRYE